MGKYGDHYSQQCRERKTPADDDIIEYRYLNMDNQCYTTQERLLKYASDFKGGTHRVVSEGVLNGEPVLTAYGTRPYTHEDMCRLNGRLSKLSG